LADAAVHVVDGAKAEMRTNRVPIAVLPPKRVRVHAGHCFYCLSSLLAYPDGSSPQHIDGTKYGECAPAKKAKGER
jgi:hypothetical protein